MNRMQQSSLKADLSISGSGSLHAEGNYDMAIHSKDFLYFDGNGTYDILAAGDGVKGQGRRSDHRDAHHANYRRK